MKGLTDASSKDVCVVPKTPDSKMVLMVRRTLTERERILCSLCQEESLFSFTHASSPFPVMDLCLFVAASHQTRLDTRSKARRPIKVGMKGRGRSGTSRDSNPAGLCCSSAYLVQCEPYEASSFTNPNVGPGTYAGLWLELDSKV